MLKHYFYSLVVLLFLSCTKINYVGNSYNPTSNVEVFVDEGAIKRRYDVVGKGYVQSTTTASEKIQTKAIEIAKQKGADAILIQDLFTYTMGLRTDSTNKAAMNAGNTVVRQSAAAEFIVLFFEVYPISFSIHVQRIYSILKFTFGKHLL